METLLLKQATMVEIFKDCIYQIIEIQGISTDVSVMVKVFYQMY